jgi:hypothetical protein
MKNKLIAVIATLGMVASASAVKVNNNLSINGFIDGSYASSDDGTAGGKSQELGLDEVEINFVLNVGNVSGLIAIDTDDATGYHDANNNGVKDTGETVIRGDSTDLFNIEQAHFTYNINDAVSVTFGRYGSALGFEREDPAGLYTFSRAYSDGSAFNFGNVDANVVEGLTVAYSADAYSVAVSLENQVGADLQANDLDFEISLTYTGIAGVNIGGGFTVDNEETGNAESDAINFHVSRQFGKLLLAGEYSSIDTAANGSAAAEGDRDAYMILADYDINNKLGVALRISSEELTATTDYDKFTIAPNYAITESLGAILEYSDVDNAGTDSEEYAVELTYTF